MFFPAAIFPDKKSVPVVLHVWITWQQTRKGLLKRLYIGFKELISSKQNWSKIDGNSSKAVFVTQQAAFYSSFM